jgi:hypothetical protein
MNAKPKTSLKQQAIKERKKQRKNQESNKCI